MGHAPNPNLGGGGGGGGNQNPLVKISKAKSGNIALKLDKGVKNKHNSQNQRNPFGNTNNAFNPSNTNQSNVFGNANVKNINNKPVSISSNPFGGNANNNQNKTNPFINNNNTNNPQNNNPFGGNPFANKSTNNPFTNKGDKNPFGGPTQKGNNQAQNQRNSNQINNKSLSTNNNPFGGNNNNTSQKPLNPFANNNNNNNPNTNQTANLFDKISNPSHKTKSPFGNNQINPQNTQNPFGTTNNRNTSLLNDGQNANQKKSANQNPFGNTNINTNTNFQSTTNPQSSLFGNNKDKNKPLMKKTAKPSKKSPMESPPFLSNRQIEVVAETKSNKNTIFNKPNADSKPLKTKVSGFNQQIDNKSDKLYPRGDRNVIHPKNQNKAAAFHQKPSEYPFRDDDGSHTPASYRTNAMCDDESDGGTTTPSPRDDDKSFNQDGNELFSNVAKLNRAERFVSKDKERKAIRNLDQDNVHGLEEGLDDGNLQFPNNTPPTLPPKPQPFTQPFPPPPPYPPLKPGPPLFIAYSLAEEGNHLKQFVSNDSKFVSLIKQQDWFGVLSLSYTPPASASSSKPSDDLHINALDHDLKPEHLTQQEYQFHHHLGLFLQWLKSALLLNKSILQIIRNLVDTFRPTGSESTGSTTPFTLSEIEQIVTELIYKIMTTLAEIVQTIVQTQSVTSFKHSFSFFGGNDTSSSHFVLLLPPISVFKTAVESYISQISPQSIPPPPVPLTSALKRQLDDSCDNPPSSSSQMKKPYQSSQISTSTAVIPTTKPLVQLIKADKPALSVTKVVTLPQFDQIDENGNDGDYFDQSEFGDAEGEFDYYDGENEMFNSFEGENDYMFGQEGEYYDAYEGEGGEWDIGEGDDDLLLENLNDSDGDGDEYPEDNPPPKKIITLKKSSESQHQTAAAKLAYDAKTVKQGDKSNRFNKDQQNSTQSGSEGHTKSRFEIIRANDTAKRTNPHHQPSSAGQTYPKKHEQKGVDIKINTDKRPLTLTHTAAAAAAGHDQLNNKHPTPKDFKIIKTQHPKQTPTPSMNPNGPPPSQLMHHAYNQHVNSNSPHHHAHQNNNFTPDWRSTKPCRFGADCYKPQCPFQHPTS
jgi:hypothetical protein